MKVEEQVFAKKHLSSAVRFATALKITSKVFLHKRYNAPVVLYAIMDSIEVFENPDKERLTSYQKNMMVGISFSEETNREVLAYFTQVYNDDDRILAWLNNRLTEKGVNRMTYGERRDESEAVSIAKKVVSSNLLDNLGLSF